LGDQPGFVAEIVDSFHVCYPLTELRVIRHEPDNRFLECALVTSADFIVTVNTAPGHFDRPTYQSIGVVRPREFLNVPEVVSRGYVAQLHVMRRNLGHYSDLQLVPCPAGVRHPDEEFRYSSG
jgi:hypothetical protein